MIGEGAGTLILEELEHAKRAARPFTVKSSALRLTATRTYYPAAARNHAVLYGAIAEIAGLSAQDIGYISAHGTATDAVIWQKVWRQQPFTVIMCRFLAEKLFWSYAWCLWRARSLMSLQMMREGWFAPTLNLNKPTRIVARWITSCMKPARLIVIFAE